MMFLLTEPECCTLFHFFEYIYTNMTPKIKHSACAAPCIHVDEMKDRSTESSFAELSACV